MHCCLVASSTTCYTLPNIVVFHCVCVVPLALLPLYTSTCQRINMCGEYLCVAVCAAVVNCIGSDCNITHGWFLLYCGGTRYNTFAWIEATRHQVGCVLIGCRLSLRNEMIRLVLQIDTRAIQTMKEHIGQTICFIFWLILQSSNILLWWQLCTLSQPQEVSPEVLSAYWLTFRQYLVQPIPNHLNWFQIRWLWRTSHPSLSQ